ncbi:MAG: RidA family protein [Candidatus Aminicenantes bacterium]|jgi:enamine deaminase RidA (YjgF/YER057c/UK114 family)
MNWEVKYYPEYWVGKKLAYPHVPKESPKFARSMVVGNLIFVSGCTGQDTIDGKPTADTFEDQMKMALHKVKMAMEEAGSSMENIVKTVMLIKNRDDYPKMRKTEVEYYMEHAPNLVEDPPASTFIVPASLARPEFLIEVDVIGVIDRDEPKWNVKHYAEYWGGKKLAYPHVPKEHPKFARTQVVGDLVMVSGCEALDHDTLKVETDDFKEQTRICLEKMKAGMEETGGSMNNLVKTYVLLKDIKDYPLYREVEQAFFRQHAPDLAKNPPASTVINVASLALPEFLVEVEAFGVIDKEKPDWATKYYPGSEEASSSASAGHLLFLSGCDGSDPKTGKIESYLIEEQINIALDKVRAAMQGAGSSMEKMVKTFMLLRHLEDYPRMRKTEVEYYEKHAPHLVDNPPVSTFMQLTSMTNPEALFEMDVTAVL